MQNNDLLLHESLKDSPRYLTAFHPKKQSHCFVDVLVVGGGIAGLRACLAIDPQLSVLLVTKSALAESNSNFAQGGIASVLDPLDNFENHVADTITAGGNLCDSEVVEHVIREAPEHIRQLIAWGTQFDEDDGKLRLGREGGHSHNRIAHALGDATGHEIIRALMENVRSRENTRVWEDTFTLDLLTENESCRGALVHCPKKGRLLVWAKQTILCTGGAGQLYRETTNPEVATADGHAIAFRAGVQLADMEFMQFHPTVLYIAGSSRSLISEAVRGDGAILVDKNGHRFMSEYDERLELAPRDVVSRAITTQMEKTQHPNVYLDLSHLDAEHVRKRFPGIAAACLEFDIDIATDRIPVRPGAHYMIGGVTVDSVGKTTLDGLWAAGEVTSSGLHGANRLASNSLLEGLVYGASAGKGASEAASQMPDAYHAAAISQPKDESTPESLNVADICNALQSLLWREASVRRNREGLENAAETIDMWCHYVLPRQFSDPQGWELQNLLITARLLVGSALKREETRGVHLRTDFPEPDEEHWHRRLVVLHEDSK